MNDDEELIERVITGDLLPDAPELRHACRDRPGLADRLAALRGVQRRLDAAGSYALARQGADSSSAELEFARQFRRRLERRGRWRSAWVPATAAAALIVGILVLNGRGDGSRSDEDRDRMRLGTGERPIPNQLSSQSRFDRFDWGRLPFDATHSYRLTVYRDPARLEPLAPPIETRERSWRPDAADEAGWPDRIYYLLEVFDASDARRGTYDEEAQRTH